jgi:SAM-dependent methyltransferase
MSDQASAHYEADYFRWQESLGEFGGWADLGKFIDYVPPEGTVLDFGCGGGYLLANLKCRRRLGVEVNPAAASSARSKGIEVFSCVADVPDHSADLVISNHALEHTLRPLDELKALRPKLREGGKVVFVVPCEAISYGYRPGDVNRHLYTWSPMCLGNLFDEAGFSVIESKPYIHKWPPNYQWVARVGGRRFFDLVCRIYGRIDRTSFQIKLVAEA